MQSFVGGAWVEEGGRDCVFYVEKSEGFPENINKRYLSRDKGTCQELISVCVLSYRICEGSSEALWFPLVV